MAGIREQVSEVSHVPDPQGLHNSQWGLWPNLGLSHHEILGDLVKEGHVRTHAIPLGRNKPFR